MRLKLIPFILLIISLTVTSCHSSKKLIQFSSERVSDREDYFANPDKILLERNTEENRRAISRYSETMRDFNESSFYYDSLEYEAYRFVLSGYLEPTVLFRIEKRESAVLFWQEKQESQNGELPHITDEQSIGLSLKDRGMVEEVFESIGYWEFDLLNESPLPPSTSGQLSIEGWKEGKHQIVLRDHLSRESRIEVDSLMSLLFSKTDFSERFEGFTLPAGSY